MKTSLPSWIISSRGEKRFAQGHPWVFSNEITNSLKSVSPGSLVSLDNEKGQRLALGYGNPNSLIAFRVLSRDALNIDRAWVIKKLLEAAQWRHRLGLCRSSHRLIFSEADSLPGLIIDVFKTSKKQQVFVLEILTAGMEKLLSDVDEQACIEEFIHQARALDLPYEEWTKTSLVFKKDNSFRKMENLPEVETTTLGALNREELKNQEIMIAQSLHKTEEIGFRTDLVDGQKTGFFLDQRSNIEMLLHHLGDFNKKQPVRILDLFCYVGQWSAQIACELQKRGYLVDVTCVDASQKALGFAENNVKKFCEKFTAQKMDIVEKCQDLPHSSFDIVICDPPALIKSKKDHPAGKNAYGKINAAALRSLKSTGLFISCSCSQHLSDEDLIEVLSGAMYKARKSINWVAKGQQGADHPMRIEFPQGTYLNSWLGLAKEVTP